MIIGKVGKRFKLITKVRNMRLHLTWDAFRNNKATDILRSLMADSYYDGREVEILSLTKSDTDKDSHSLRSPLKRLGTTFLPMA